MIICENDISSAKSCQSPELTILPVARNGLVTYNTTGKYIIAEEAKEYEKMEQTAVDGFAAEAARRGCFSDVQSGPPREFGWCGWWLSDS